ncbi:MAG: hypothetical protein HC911_14655 [Chloroflexaceae bacterium]|nr:hypothetical protein [Chloroflexaceae bacterium]
MEPRKYFRIPEIRIPLPHFSRLAGGWQRWVPTPGNILFTLLVATLLLGASSVGALPLLQSTPTSTGTIAYQGRLADASGTPLTNSYPMTFRLYEAVQGGTPLWTEQWTGPNSVQVSDGLFNVMLGSLEPIDVAMITAHDTLWLGITVGNDDEMAPRVQLGTVPFAMQALTVPDGSVTTAKLADGSVGSSALANGAVTKAKLGSDVTLVPPDGSITTAKLANGSVTTAKLADGVLTQTGHKAATPGDPVMRFPEGVRQYQEIPGTRTTVTVNVPSTILINASFDFLTTKENSALAGTILINGQPSGTQAVVQGLDATRATAATQTRVNLSPGTHTIHLAAYAADGTGVLHGHTGYTYIVVAR